MHFNTSKAILYVKGTIVSMCVYEGGEMRDNVKSAGSKIGCFFVITLKGFILQWPADYTISPYI